MFKALHITIIAAALTVGAAHAAVNPLTQFGMPTQASNADRQIVIDAGTKWVNVNNGDTVTFDVNGQSFTWHFETLHSEEVFDLAKIAPQAVSAGMVTVYVASNPLYRG